MSKVPVSVCIIAKNEEKFIEDCLKHLLPYGMEIIVADTGSTDRTKEIAEKYADRVVDFEWVNDFAAAETIVRPLPKITGYWRSTATRSCSQSISGYCGC